MWKQSIVLITYSIRCQPVLRLHGSGLYSPMGLLGEMWAKHEQLIEFVCVPKYDRNVRISYRDSCHLLIIVR